VRQLVQAAAIDEPNGKAALPLANWQELLDLQAQLAEYLRMIGDPEGEGS
jgi:hypothetical protein